MVKVRQFSTLKAEDFAAWLSDPDNVNALMASDPKVVQSAMRKAGRFGIPWPASQEPEMAPAEPQEDPEPPAVEPDNRMERFACNHLPQYKIAVGNKIIAFSNGVFTTKEADEVYAIMRDPWFGIHIHPDNKDLLEAAKWLK